MFLCLSSLDLSQLLVCQVKVTVFLHSSLSLFPETQDFISSAQVTRVQAFKYTKNYNQDLLWNDTADWEHELLLELSQPWINNCYSSINLRQLFCGMEFNFTSPGFLSITISRLLEWLLNT